MGDRDPGGRGPRRVEVPGLSPVRAFFVVGALAAIPLALLATRSAEPSTSPEPARRSPSYELTDAEAIAEFERLHDLQVQAYESRDVTLIPATYTTDSPVAHRVEREITTLIRKDITTETEFVTQRVTVKSLIDHELVIHQSVLIDASFFNSRGAEVSIDAPPELQTIRWTLKRVGGEWRIYDAEILRSRAVREGST